MMIRRDALKFAIGLFCLPSRRGVYGYVDVDRAIREGWYPATVYIDGVEAKECFACDDRIGFVECNVLDADGRACLNASGDGPLRRRRYGRVRFVPNTSFA